MSSPNPPEPPANALASAGPWRVLVVDDVEAVASFVAAMVHRVRDGDAVVEVATTARRAVESAAARPFDLVVADFRLDAAGTTGLDVLRTARRTAPAGRRVLMTAYPELRVPASETREAGVDAYLRKPVPAQELLLVLRDLLRASPEPLARRRATARDVERRGMSAALGPEGALPEAEDGFRGRPED